MRHPSFFLAYHGCDRSLAERVLAGAQEVRASGNEYDWLGNGAYFWENSAHRALEWAEFLMRHPSSSRGRIGKPAVLGAVIDPGNCLDLTETASLGLLADAFHAFEALSDAAGLPLPKNEPGYEGDQDLVRRFLDCAVINHLHQVRGEAGSEPFDTVRGAFFEGVPLFPGSKIASKTHVQWCVRNCSKSVVGYFRPRV